MKLKHQVSRQKFVLIVEPPGEPPRYFGPFVTRETAWQYARGWCAGVVVMDERMQIGTSWGVAALETPGDWLSTAPNVVVMPF